MEETNALIQQRKAKLEALRARGIDPFRNKFRPTEKCAQARGNYIEGREVALAGRITAHRDMGKSMFIDIKDQSGRIQVYAQKNVIGDEQFDVFRHLDLGDFLGVRGTLFTTKTGEISVRIDLQILGAANHMAMLRKIGGVQYLWTCREIGVNATGGHSAEAPADRSAIEWLQIQTGPTVSLAASGRIYDNATTSPRFYYMPSLAVNKNGDMVLGFSGSSANEYVSAYYTGRLNNGVTPISPIRYFAGKDWLGNPNFSNTRCGDYSFTSLDPDGFTMWTIQEYAETRYLPVDANANGTRISAITP